MKSELFRVIVNRIVEELYARTVLPAMSSVEAFNVAAKHLFRHLHEPSFLRVNPIARRFFQDETGAALPSEREGEALAKLHELVLHGAVLCRDADLARGKQRKHFASTRSRQSNAWDDGLFEKSRSSSLRLVTW